MGGANLTPARADLMFLLKGGPLVQRQIAELLTVSRPVISRMVTSLEKLQFVERVAVAHDRRYRLIRLTPKGFKELEKVLDGFVCEDPSASVQYTAEGLVMQDWEIALRRAGVKADVLSEEDQFPLLKRMYRFTRSLNYHHEWLEGGRALEELRTSG